MGGARALEDLLSEGFAEEFEEGNLVNVFEVGEHGVNVPEEVVEMEHGGERSCGVVGGHCELLYRDYIIVDRQLFDMELGESRGLYLQQRQAQNATDSQPESPPSPQGSSFPSTLHSADARRTQSNYPHV